MVVMFVLKNNVSQYGKFLLPAIILTVFIMVAAIITFKGLFIGESDWYKYKSMFISEQGRIIDTGNGGVSHSEGQGWGMLLAVENNDKAAFALIWNWTQTHLQIREDKLFSWRWMPVGLDIPVPDPNNASDGDIYIAWALLRAAERWQQPEYTKQALHILNDIQKHLVRDYANLSILLPAKEGFMHKNHVVLNLSYWVFAAFEDFKRIDPSPTWEKLQKSGQQLLSKARFGQWNLPPDWTELSLQGNLQPAENFPPRFGYDAIRVPLALYWGKVNNKALLKPYNTLYSSSSFSSKHPLPAWFGLHDNSVAPYAANDGFLGVLSLVSRSFEHPINKSNLPHILTSHDYYTASLVMLTQQAISEVDR